VGTARIPVAGGQDDARPLSGDKAQRIIEAMRESVARKGLAGATFDQVAREAGVSRGLLHYYFGTKEQLLVQAVRRDAELRLQSLEARLEPAKSGDDFVALMAQDLQEALAEDPDFTVLIFELFTLARRNEYVASEFAALLRSTRETVSAMLEGAQKRGAVKLAAPAECVTDVLFSVADGFALRMLGDPERDFSQSVAVAVGVVRPLLGGS
jgi:AcrR family transcriptional regulator